MTGQWGARQVIGEQDNDQEVGSFLSSFRSLSASPDPTARQICASHFYSILQGEQSCISADSRTCLNRPSDLCIAFLLRSPGRSPFQLSSRVVLGSKLAAVHPLSMSFHMRYFACHWRRVPFHSTSLPLSIYRLTSRPRVACMTPSKACSSTQTVMAAYLTWPSNRLLLCPPSAWYYPRESQEDKSINTVMLRWHSACLLWGSQRDADQSMTATKGSMWRSC